MPLLPITFNPHLLSAKNAKRSQNAGQGLIFQPGEEENLRWQTRPSEPSAYEQALAAAIVQVFAEDGHTPEDFAERLNTMNMLQPDGDAWTPATLGAELGRLAG